MGSLRYWMFGDCEDGDGEIGMTNTEHFGHPPRVHLRWASELISSTGLTLETATLDTLFSY